MSPQNDYPIQGWNPTSIFCRKLNAVYGRLEPCTTVRNRTLLCCQNRELFSIYRATRYRLVHENDQHVQGWNPTIIYFQKLNTVWGVRVKAST